VACGIAAYGLWGLIPLYFKAVAHVAPVEVLAHRAAWSFAVLAALVLVLGRGRETWRNLRSSKLMLLLGLSTLLIAANWLIFIYAVESRQLVQASLGYFINPLVNVLLGVAFLRERLRTAQTASIGLAGVGVAILAGLVGALPWIALALALTFGFYGLLRKIMPVDGLAGLTVETLLMTPVALAYLGYLGLTAEGGRDLVTWLLLMLSGPVTTVPLLFFVAAARRLRLATLGILQYLAPSLQFLLAVVAFGEPFSSAQLLSFGCIWTAILIYTLDALRAAQRPAIAVLEPD
jgi:chloramphenicol-sensitive protein RarD